MTCNFPNINCHLTSKAKFLGSLKSSRALLLVQFGYNCVRRMRYNGTKYSSNVASSKCYHKLFCLAALTTGLWYDIPEKKC